MSDVKTCKRVWKLLERFLDGELSAQEQEWVKSEVAQCAGCRAELERLGKLRALVREVYIDEARSANLDGILPGVLKRLENTPQGFMERFMVWLDRYRLSLASPIAPVGVAATLVVAVLAATLIFVNSGTKETGTVPTAQQEAGEASPAPEGLSTQKASPGELVAKAEGERRAAYGEKPYRKNECRITYYEVGSGTVIVDVDPDGDTPAVVWHFPDEEGTPPGKEDNRI